MPNDIKQVIVMRTHYPDGNGGLRKLRTGKMIAQACHASMAFIGLPLKKYYKNDSCIILENTEREWFKGSFAKIVCYVKTEEELFQIYGKAKANGLHADLITDNGATEFNGVPTVTCLGIGPDYSSKIDPITGELPLL